MAAMTALPRSPPRRLLTFDGKYLAATLLLLAIETFIALRVRDAWIRPYGGDVLAVIFLYCLVRTFLKLPVVPAVIGVLATAFVIEFLQYLNFVDRVGLRRCKVLVVVLGSSFAWEDLLCYALGAALVLVFERLRGKP
jgi:hypothetical protein